MLIPGDAVWPARLTEHQDGPFRRASGSAASCHQWSRHLTQPSPRKYRRPLTTKRSARRGGTVSERRDSDRETARQRGREAARRESPLSHSAVSIQPEPEPEAAPLSRSRSEPTLVINYRHNMASCPGGGGGGVPLSTRQETAASRITPGPGPLFSSGAQAAFRRRRAHWYSSWRVQCSAPGSSCRSEAGD